MKVVAIVNQKCGVAKTTTTHNLGIALAAKGKQVFLIDLVPMEMELLSRDSRKKILDRALEPVRGEYDFILVDCPPQLSILTIDAPSCADGVIIPVKTDCLAYWGMTQLQDSI